MSGILRELEAHRLRAHSPATIDTARKLTDELLSLSVLPAPCARLLRWFRRDLDDIDPLADDRATR